MTPFGKYIRRLRLERNMILKNMADDLGVSIVFLSKVEHGKETIPHHWLTTIPEIYNLSESETAIMKNAFYHFDPRKRLMDEPGKWVLAYLNENNRWVKIGFDRGEMMAIKAPIKLDVPADSMCPGISFPNGYEIDRSIPIEQVV